MYYSKSLTHLLGLNVSSGRLLRGSGYPEGEKGLSLVELLIGLVIASIVIGATSFLLLAELRNTARFEEANRAEENLSRVIGLINAESAEGYELSSVDGVNSACTPSPSLGGIIEIKLRDVAVSGDPLDLASALDPDATISYYNVNGAGIYRCGPELYPFSSTYLEFQDGRINYSTCCTARLVGPGISLSLGDDILTGTSEERIDYSLSIVGKAYSRVSAAVSGGRHLRSPTWAP